MVDAFHSIEGATERRDDRLEDPALPGEGVQSLVERVLVPFIDLRSSAHVPAVGVIEKTQHIESSG